MCCIERFSIELSVEIKEFDLAPSNPSFPNQYINSILEGFKRGF
jgi:hypothetical protein